MIQIKKGKEPVAWTRFCATDGVSYSAIPELRYALEAEQGGICAYCMRKVPVEKPDPTETERSKIDHIQCRDRYKQRQLDYGNMVLCCPGNINGSTHCDKSKENDDVSFSPFTPHLQQSITYSTNDGTIKSSNPTWDAEINTIICLNNEMLKMNRNQTLSGVRAFIENGKWKKAKIEQALDQWRNPDQEGKRKPYCGIVIWYLEKKLKQA